MRYESKPLAPDRNTITTSYNRFKAILKEKGIEILLSVENENLPYTESQKQHVLYCRSLYCNKKGVYQCCKTCEDVEKCGNACLNNPNKCGLRSYKRIYRDNRGYTRCES